MYDKEEGWMLSDVTSRFVENYDFSEPQEKVASTGVIVDHYLANEKKEITEVILKEIRSAIVAEGLSKIASNEALNGNHKAALLIENAIDDINKLYKEAVATTSQDYEMLMQYADDEELEDEEG